MLLKRTLLFGTASAVLIALLASQDVFSHYEEPSYEVTHKEGNIEIRQYPVSLTAEVRVSGTGKSAANEAFRILAGFIFGKNRAKEKIAMTVPVTTENVSTKIAMTVPVTTELSEGQMRMRFFLPSKFTMETLPEPIDKRIEIKTFPSQSFAVIKFSGLLDEKTAKENEEKLADFMQKHSYKARGVRLLSSYNPPWTIPFLRRNEVWIPL